MGMKICATKEVQATQKWKDLERSVGKEQAHTIYEAMGGNIPDLDSTKNYFVTHKGSSQEEVLTSLLKTKVSFKEEKADYKIPETKHPLSGIYADVTDVKERTVPRYELKTGEIVTNRPTDEQTKLFMRNKTFQEAQEINNAPENIIKRDRGTQLHDVQQHIIESIREGKEPVKPSFLKQKDFDELRLGISKLIENIQEVQNLIDPNKKVKILTENIVHDRKNDTAGSIDLLAVFSDGSAAIYDFKFINFFTEKGVVKDFENKIDIKEESWDIQIGEYKRILKDVYGINTIRQSRIIPINVQYKKIKKGDKRTITDEITKLEAVGKEYTEYLPVANEMTEDKKLNTLLKELFHLRKTYKEKKKSAKDYIAYEARIKRVEASIRSLQRKKDFNFFVNEINAIIKEVGDKIETNNPEDPNFLSDKDLVSFVQYLRTYTNFIERSSETIGRAIAANPELYEGFNSKLAMANTRAAMIVGTIEAKLEERADIYGTSYGINNIGDIQKDTSTLGNYTRYLSDFNHPIFRVFKKMTQKMINDTNRSITDVDERLKEVDANLTSWAESQGMKGLDKFKPLINPKTGNLVQEFTEEFWKLRNKAIKDKNIKWLRENFSVTKEDKEEYQKEYEEYKERIAKNYFNKTEKEREKIIQRWVERNDTSKSAEAWFNNYARITIKDPSKWRSSEYQHILNNKPLKDYYDFYTTMNKEFHSILPKSAKVSKNFVASIKKDTIDMIAENKDVIKGLAEGWRESLRMREDDTKFGMVNPITGEVEHRIPILYNKPIRDRGGNMDPNLKSGDLSRSLLLFAKMAYTYRHASQIEERTQTLREVLSKRDQYITDHKGDLIPDASGMPEIGTGSENTLKAFDAFVNFYLYGQTIQNKDKAIKLGDASYSMTKIVQEVRSFVSLKTIGLNPVSAAAAYLGASSNMWMLASGGQYYTKKQLRKAHALNIKKDDTASAVFKYLATEQEDLNYRKANELSASKLARTFTMDNAYIGIQKADQAVDFNTTLAMLQNYGTNPETGKITRLSRLPEGTKSIWDRTSIKNDKVVIEEFDEKQYDALRTKVMAVTAKIKGQYSKEDLLLANTHILGQSLLMYRQWMPKLVAERFRTARYNEDLEEIEMGRYRVFFGELMAEGVLPKVKNLSGLLLEIISFGGAKHKLTEGQTSRYFDEYLAQNPQMQKRIDNGEFTREELFEQYQETRIAQFRSLAFELRTYLVILAFIAAAGTDWDDDGEKFYEEFPLGAELIKIIDRYRLEVGAFVQPSDAKQLLRNPFPIASILFDIEKLISNSLDETRDVLAGEDYKGMFTWEKDTNDKTPKFKYTSKFLPFIAPNFSFFDVQEKIDEALED